MRKKEIKCPYCGSKAKLVHFYDIYGKLRNSSGKVCVGMRKISTVRFLCKHNQR